MVGNVDFFSRQQVAKSAPSLKPFFSIKNKPEQEILQWLKDSVELREKHHREFFDTARENLIAYSGQRLVSSRRRQSESLEVRPMRRPTNYSVNHLYEMTENLVSKMTRIKPAVEVIPANYEFEDKNSAKAVKLLIQHLWYINDADKLLQKLHRHKYIFGEGNLLIDWDQSLGDLHPDYVTLRDKDQLDKLPKGAPIRTGDVCYEILLPWKILPETTKDYDKAKTLIIKNVMHIEEAKDKFSEHASKFKKSKGATDFSLSSLKDENLADHVLIYTMYHRADDHFPKGKKIVFTDDFIIEQDDLGYSHGDFPIIRITDIDVPGSFHGISRYQQCKVIQNAHDNLSQSIMKNEFLMAAPKWIMPRKACKLDQLANGRTIVQYQGSVPPQLVQMNPTSANTFNFRDRIEAELGQIMGVHQVSRGEPPKGITAAVALQFLNEQETERAVSDIAKHNELVKAIAIKSISVAGDYYQPDDGRMLRILGKENKYMIKYFNQSHLHKDYDVRIQNSSAVPQSKAARMERILQTMQYAPTLFTQERWAELLEFGSVEKMHTMVTEAISAAESTVEDILEGVPVEEPKEWEDLITHLRVYYKKVQPRSFKEDVPEERREALIMHIKVTEMLAAEKAGKNPLFASKLSALELFPLFWEAPVPPSKAQSEAMVQGQSNRGEEVTASIPAEELDAMPGEAINKGGL